MPATSPEPDAGDGAALRGAGDRAALAQPDAPADAAPAPAPAAADAARAAADDAGGAAPADPDDPDPDPDPDLDDDDGGADPDDVGDGAARPEPLIFAHRGASQELPEHTLDAYLRAIADGADGVECDVRLTRDGHLVCIHDRRLNRTSNGRGPVRRHTLAELAELDYGSWHSRPASLLTLETLLGAVRDAGRPLRVLIETKHPTLGGRLLEPAVAATLRRFNLDRPAPDDPAGVTMMSFSPLALQRMRAHAPDVPRVFLMEVLPPGLRTGQLPYGARAGGPSIGLLRARPVLARRLQERGNQVYVWTVNEPADVDLCVRLGVTGIITDRPGFVRARLRQPTPQG